MIHAGCQVHARRRLHSPAHGRLRAERRLASQTPQRTDRTGWGHRMGSHLTLGAAVALVGRRHAQAAPTRARDQGASAGMLLATIQHAQCCLPRGTGRAWRCTGAVQARATWQHAGMPETAERSATLARAPPAPQGREPAAARARPARRHAEAAAGHWLRAPGRSGGRVRAGRRGRAGGRTAARGAPRCPAARSRRRRPRAPGTPAQARPGSWSRCRSRRSSRRRSSTGTSGRTCWGIAARARARARGSGRQAGADAHVQ